MSQGSSCTILVYCRRQVQKRAFKTRGVGVGGRQWRGVGEAISHTCSRWLPTALGGARGGARGVASASSIPHGAPQLL